MTGDLVSQRLAEAEAIIERGLGTFMDVGNALARVRDERLYRGTHGNFEDYCRARWAMSRKRAYDLMSAAETVEALSPIGDILPTTESQARELTGLPPAVAAEVMQAAAESGKVTAATIRDARQSIQPTRPATWLCGTCGEAFKTAHTHCDTCGEHYPEPVHCPDHHDVVNIETGEMLDGPTLAGRAAADRAPLPRIPRPAKTDADYDREARQQEITAHVSALIALSGMADPIARARYVLEYDPNLSGVNPCDFVPSTIREVAHGLLAFADEMESHRELRVV